MATLIEQLHADAAAEGVEIAPKDASRYSTLAGIYGGYASRYKGSGTYLDTILSAAAHGRRWGMHLARSDVTLREGRYLPKAPSNPEVDQPITIMSVSTALWATRKVLEVVDIALEEAELYAGVERPAFRFREKFPPRARGQ
ncbi:MAG TPA: hypothetical protein VF365_07450 [Candidatus Limnocylindria bacterium]